MESGMEKTANPRNQLSIETAARQAGLTHEAAGSAKFWLADQLMAHEHAKLGQGGHTNTQIPLRRVFVDLPVAVRDRAESHGFLSRLMRSPVLDLSDRDVFQPGQRQSGVQKANEGSTRLAKRVQARQRGLSGWGAVLLVGGPGQGKSTLGQLACQLHRAVLLRPYRSDLTRSQGEVVRSLTDGTSSSDARTALPLPAQALIPIHISLPEFVAWATKGVLEIDAQVPLLLRFIEQLPSASRLSFTARSLLVLCKQIGCLVVLDGFDEVGATRDRDLIVNAATELLWTLRQLDVSSQFLITTRPQGYAGEMGGLGLRLQEQTLIPLAQVEALRYAEKLIWAKIDGADQRQVMFDRVKEAASEPATQRLLTTPLQVTILTALVQHMGRAPRERWNLFESYFSYTYIREIERGSYASALLSDHRSHVEQIHARIALILQVESEQQGGAAGITKARLEEVISTVLSEEEVPADRRKELVRDISKAAEERLVFLVEPEPGKFGFEIRSLQEFMAAKALTTGRDSAVENRVRYISKAAMFRNTTLFCASRFFSEASPLRDFFIDDVCARLDDRQADGASAAAKSGGLLALETLEEGAVLTQPKRARLLMERAVGLLEIPASVEHVRLSLVANSDTSEVLESKILRHFATQLSQRKFNDISVWVSVLAAVARDELWGLVIAEKNVSELILNDETIQVFARCNVQVSLWLAKLIEALPLTQVTQFFGHDWAYTDAAKTTWLAHVEKVFGAEHLGRRRRNHHHINIIGNVVPITPLAPPNYPLPTQWEGILALTDYEQNPSASRLAEALRNLAAGRPSINRDFLLRRSSWPLASCLWRYISDNELVQCANDLDSGKFFDVDEWGKWERNWVESPFNAVTILAVSDADPFDQAARSQAPPLSCVPQWILLDQARAPKFGRAMYEIASRLFQTVRHQGNKALLAETCLSTLAVLPSRLARDFFKPKEWIPFVPDAASYLAIQPKSFKRADWLEALDLCEKNFEGFYLGVNSISQAVEDSYFHPTVVRVFLSTIYFYAQHMSNREDFPLAGSEKIAQAIIDEKRWDVEGALGANFALIVLMSGTFAAEFDRVLIDKVIVEAKNNASYWLLLIHAISLSQLSVKRRLDLIVSIYKDLNGRGAAAEAAMRFIKSHLQKAVSDLGLAQTWDRLTLPLPRPREGIDAKTHADGTLEPVFLNSIRLKDIAGISNLKLSFNAPSSGGQWIVILGPNGTGKSTILKSVALGLRNVRDPIIWPRGAFSGSWIRLTEDSESPVVDASISIELSDGETYETVIRMDDSVITLNQTPELQRSRACTLYAYGCRRGSALGGGSRAVNVNDDDGPEVATLFDSDANLVHAETWLVGLEGDAARNDSSRMVFAAVCSALKALLGFSSIEVKDQKVWVCFSSGPHLPLSAMSDGYLTSAGWFLDLISRWLVSAAENHIQFSDDFLSRMTGLVLIDEIDLHLHPRWQVDVISRTRKLLPNMSFVVTTHNPLTLVGADASEIFILQRDQFGVSVVSGTEKPALLSGGQLYRRYFGIEDIYPMDTARDVQRFGFLSGIGKRTTAENAELGQLRDSLVSVGYISEEFIDEALDPLNFLSEK
jgi:hypothetical protein